MRRLLRGMAAGRRIVGILRGGRGRFETADEMDRVYALAKEAIAMADEHNLEYDFIVVPAGPHAGLYVYKGPKEVLTKREEEMAMGRVFNVKNGDVVTVPREVKIIFANEEQWSRALGLMICDLAFRVQT